MFTLLLLSSVLTAYCAPRRFGYASKISRILSTLGNFSLYVRVQIFVIAYNISTEEKMGTQTKRDIVINITKIFIFAYDDTSVF